MLKKIRILVYSLFILLLLSGCNVNASTNDLFAFKDSFVGDNSAVGSITNQLKGAEHLNGFELKTVQQPYGIIFDYDWFESEEKQKETVIYNATYLFSLIQNLEWLTFQFDTDDYTLTKKELENWYGEEFDKIESEDELRKLIEEAFSDKSKIDAFIELEG